ncbi:hypothetical protein IAI18_12585 [Acetobacteraceae bacterium H6797]|nr:hypothetical protein [Acetobacteraceae bacterium H6797]
MDTVVTDQNEKNNRRWHEQIRWPWRMRRHRITPTERALIGAQGKALTMLLTALQARGHLNVEEFADTLGIFSVVVAEDNKLEGDILAVWAGTMKESL